MTGSLAIRPCTRGLHDLGKGARAWLLPVVALCLLLAGCIAPALLLPSLSLIHISEPTRPY